MLGRNVTAKLDENTRTKCHRLCDKILQGVGMSHCDKPSKFTRSECHNLGWTNNRSTLRRNVTGAIVSAGGSLGGRIVWVKMSRGRFVGGRIVKAPDQLVMYVAVVSPPIGLPFFPESGIFHTSL
jgi:hypothetical protein